MHNFKRKICWVTPDYFLSVDSFIVPMLSKDYDIDWISVSSPFNKRNLDNIRLNYKNPKDFLLRYRQKDPRIIIDYIKLINKIRTSNADLIYISFHGVPYFFPLCFLFLNTDKIVYAVHNVSTPKGASNEFLMRIYHKYVFRKVNYFQVFSKNQLKIIKKLLPGKKHYYAPLALADFGPSNVIPPREVIRFLFFGYIRKYKRLDLLIQAFQDLFLSGVTNIELIIAGDCASWGNYHSMIFIKDKIRTRIEVIPNKDVPDLVSSCHYMVLPHQDSAQSGVLTLAYQYCKPIIASNIDSFKEFIIDKSTGFFFQNKSRESLYSVMREVTLNHFKNYHKLQSNISYYVSKEFALSSIINRYKFFISDCILHNSNEKHK